MKFSNLSRIYAKIKLTENSLVVLEAEHTHYLKTVLRLKQDGQFRIFNEIDGEFIAQVTSITKNNLSATIISCLRKPVLLSELTLGLSLIKMDKMIDAINMAVQIGVTKIIPLITERSQVHTINEQRVQKCIIEATEQSERLDLPSLLPITLLKYYRNVDQNNFILYANENEEDEKSLLKALHLPENIALIVGPEGGFSDHELKMLASWLNTKSISLGPNVLRSETAVAVGLGQIVLVREKYLPNVIAGSETTKQ